MKKNSFTFNRRDFIKFTSAASIATLMPGCGFLSNDKERLNVLFVIVDDLRPELGCYGSHEIKTPHFDAFAKDAVMFNRAYCQAAACAPSRASVMLGMRAETTGVYSLGDKFREINPDAVTMPQHFHKFGYHTVSMGKIFHNHMPDPVSFDEPDLKPPQYMSPELIDRDPESFYHDEDLKKEHAEVRAERLKKNPNLSYAGGWAYGRSWESFDGPDNAFYDGAQTDMALEKLKELSDKKQPFYFALGYYRPHLPFVAPKKYWDLYDRNNLSMASNPFLPKNSPPLAINSMYELGACYDLEWVGHPAAFQMPEKTARLLKHGYYASVSFVDACLGRVMNRLKELGLDKNTIVVVWGDHGWKLGEHNSWGKQTNYNIDTRVPLFIRDPRLHREGVKCQQLIEAVDLFPTLCDLAGIPIPDNMEGISLKPMLKTPGLALKSAVFSHYHQKPRSTLDGKRYMGYSMVTSRYHYVEWYHWDDGKKIATNQVGMELYDNQVDPEENINIAGNPENVELVSKLSKQLKAGWRAAVKSD